jgi:alpha-mannosidase
MFEPILLNPYRFPGKNSLMLSNDDVASFLNGYTALWHPLVMSVASRLPRVDSSYDHEQPAAGRIFAVPETPPLLLPDDWNDRVRAAGAIAFRATPDRQATIDNLREALRSHGAIAESTAPHLLDASPDHYHAFFGIGLGFLVVEALLEAMEHQDVLTHGDILQDIQKAAGALHADDQETWRGHLRAAAERLQQAREVVYPTNIHLLDIHVLREDRLQEPAPLTFRHGLATNLVTSASLLEKWAAAHPEDIAEIRDRIGQDRFEVCGGPYLERDDALLPLESQLWNLIRGQEKYRELLGHDVSVYARHHAGYHVQLPLLLSNAGIRKAILVPFDDSVFPTYRCTIINWASPDGKHLEGFTRAPFAADNQQTWLHLAHYLHRTIMQDHGATLAFVHNQAAAAPWYRDLVELSRFAPVLGKWTTFSPYFNEVMAGEYVSSMSADDFSSDYLSMRTEAKLSDPVSWFPRQQLQRRRLDTCWTLDAIQRTLDRACNKNTPIDQELKKLEEEVETASVGARLEELEQSLAQRLANRLVAGAGELSPGYMLLNPCAFARRVNLKLDGYTQNVPLGGPIKCFQRDADKARAVVEVPALGFAWLPRDGVLGTPPQVAKIILADQYNLRNEFLEAEIDPANGCLRTIRDQRTRTNRLGQQLVYNPGSNIRVKDIKVTSAGPAMGEIVTEGTLVDPYQEVTQARFRQRFRVWLGRPVLEIRIEIVPENPVEGYPWHAYFASRFAWGDQRTVMLRGIAGSSQVTSHNRPMTPEFLELRSGRQNTVLFPCGLPFHQRHGTRMVDIILVPQGENTHSFDLAIALDREYPVQTALGLATPVTIVPVDRGPPSIGSSGWLFHLSLPNLLMTSFRPAPSGADGILLRMLECSGQYCHAELRCVRDPVRASFVDARGNSVYDQSVNGDTVTFEMAQSDLVQLHVDFAAQETPPS